MKPLALALVSALALGSAVAEPLIVQPGSPTQMIPSGYFQDEELFFDLYGGFLRRSGGGDPHGSDDNENGGGGGVSLGNYFASYFGARADVTFSSIDDAQVVIGADILFRYLIREERLAPYAFVGGGWEAEGGDHGFVRIGAGLEWRLTPKIGLFTEASYAWLSTEDSEENLLIKLGVRIVY